MPRHLRGPLRIADSDNNPEGTPTSLEFTDGSVTDNGDGTFTVTIAASPTWGTITGTLSSQTDLWNALIGNSLVSYAYYGGF